MLYPDLAVPDSSPRQGNNISPPSFTSFKSHSGKTILDIVLDIILDIVSDILDTILGVMLDIEFGILDTMLEVVLDIKILATTRHMLDKMLAWSSK